MSIDVLCNKEKDSIYYLHGSSILLLEAIKSEMHRHYPIEVYIGLDDNFEINFGDEMNECRAMVIDSNQQHQIIKSSGCLALFLLDPNIYRLIRIQKEILSDKKYFIPDSNLVFSLIEKINKFRAYPRTCNDAKNLTDELLFSLFNIDFYNKKIDPRIKTLMNILEDIPEKKIYSKELAQLVDLSESRLAHLFKEQTGTSIRRYLVWLKLKQAIRIILKGESFTTAAHESGFSDSSHLSRTYKQMFGITPSSLLKSCQSIEVNFSF